MYFIAKQGSDKPLIAHSSAKIMTFVQITKCKNAKMQKCKNAKIGAARAIQA